MEVWYCEPVVQEHRILFIRSCQPSTSPHPLFDRHGLEVWPSNVTVPNTPWILPTLLALSERDTDGEPETVQGESSGIRRRGLD